MFTFGFVSDQTKSESCTNDRDENNKNLNWLPSKEILISCAKPIKKKEEEVDLITVGSEKLYCIKLSTVLCTIKDEQSPSDKSISLAEQNHCDLIPSVYEGGLKVWECTYDIANHLNQSKVQGKAVLDLGCGVGLLGILALKLGADLVHFQDYNADVLRYTTIPNVLINGDSQQTAKCQFFSGDWKSFGELSTFKYDLIVTSETIYNPENYLKLHNIIQKVLKPTGEVLIGAKSYYFGVGGSTRQFEQVIQDKDVFNCKVIWKCSEGVQREILHLTLKNPGL